MLNLDTKRVTNIRDIKWTNKLYGEVTHKGKGQNYYYTASEEDNNDSESKEEDET